MNAKNELLKHIKDENVLCWHIWVGDEWSDEKLVDSILMVGYTPEDMERELSKLDFDYDNGYGSQELFGIVLLEGGAWLERGEYDGREWWTRKSTPRLSECGQPQEEKKPLDVVGFVLPTPEFARMARGGQYNGYIAVNRSAITEEMSYDDWFSQMDCAMHGGCTLDTFSGESFSDIDDITYVKGTPPMGKWSEYMVFGFDTLHAGDTWEYWTLERVTEEVREIINNLNK